MPFNQIQTLRMLARIAYASDANISESIAEVISGVLVWVVGRETGSQESGHDCTLEESESTALAEIEENFYASGIWGIAFEEVKGLGEVNLDSSQSLGLFPSLLRAQ